MESAAAHRRLDEHEERIKQIEKILPTLVIMSKGLATVGSALVLSILGLIWTLITGQATVVIP